MTVIAAAFSDGHDSYAAPLVAALTVIDAMGIDHLPRVAPDGLTPAGGHHTHAREHLLQYPRACAAVAA